jgi:Ca2+-dependent lipid-binding protein
MEIKIHKKKKKKKKKMNRKNGPSSPKQQTQKQSIGVKQETNQKPETKKAATNKTPSSPSPPPSSSSSSSSSPSSLSTTTPPTEQFLKLIHDSPPLTASIFPAKPMTRRSVQEAANLPANKPVILKLVAYTIIMFMLPILTYFMVSQNLRNFVSGLSQDNANSYAAVAAVVVIHFIVGAYIVSALREKDHPE